MHTNQDESDLIRIIRMSGQQIFSSDDQVSLNLTDEQNELQGRLMPYNQLLQPSHSPLRKSLNQRYNNYMSPYSQKATETKRNSNASVRRERKKIFEIYTEEKKLNKEVKSIKKENENKKYSSVKPKYLQRSVLLKNIDQIQTNIYGRLKTEVEYESKKRLVSKQHSQQKWNSFIKRNNQWEQTRQANRIKAKVNQNLSLKDQLQVRPERHSPPKPTVDECLHNLRRKAEKLKEQLSLYSFQPKLYQTERKNYKKSKEKEKEERKSKSKDKQKQQIDTNKKIKELEETNLSRLSHKDQNRKQKKFTILTNPKKQLEFIFQ